VRVNIYIHTYLCMYVYKYMYQNMYEYIFNVSFRKIQGSFRTYRALSATYRAATYCNALQCTTMHHNAPQCTAIHCNALQCIAMHCTSLQCTTPLRRCNAPHHSTRTATRRNKLQRTATQLFCGVQAARLIGCLDSQVTFNQTATNNERWGAGVEYHFQEFNEPYAPS